MTNIKTDELFLKIKTKILVFLSTKARSEYEVTKKIDSIFRLYKGAPNDIRTTITQGVISELKENGLINDEHYSSQLVSEKMQNLKSYNRIQIKRFLSRKNIPNQVINKAVELVTREDEVTSAIVHAKKKLNILSKYPKYQHRARLSKYLSSKGFSYEVINSAVDTVLGVK